MKWLIASLTLLAFLAFASSIRIHNNAIEQKAQFDLYIKTFNKTYAASEYHKRFLNFRQTLKRIQTLSAKSPSAKFAVNQFSDMSKEEFQRTRLMKKEKATTLATSCLAHGITAPQLDTSKLPASFDWRDKGKVTPVKDQGQCGSCWAFSTIGAIESAWAIKGKPLTQFSEQLLVDCSQGCSNEPPYGTVCNQGCDGGWQWNAFSDVLSWGGVETESDYPYTGVDGTCAFDKTKIAGSIKNYTCLTTPQGNPANEDQVAAYLVAHGPIPIALNADYLQDYSSGVLNPGTDCDGTSLDHALLLVGFGSDTDGTPYWIVKNSWSDSWGESGYFRIVRGQDSCGLANAVSAVIE